jgi:hypothetical protein
VRNLAGIAAEGLTDQQISAAISRYPCADAAGRFPVLRDGETNAAWAETYDTNSAVAELWERKAAMLAGNFDFSADGANFARGQAYEHAMSMARYYRARRSPTTVRLVAEPPMERNDVD